MPEVWGVLVGGEDVLELVGGVEELATFVVSERELRALRRELSPTCHSANRPRRAGGPRELQTEGRAFCR